MVRGCVRILTEVGPLSQVAARKVAEERSAVAAGASADAKSPLARVTLAVLDACKLALPSDAFDTVKASVVTKVRTVAFIFIRC